MYMHKICFQVINIIIKYHNYKYIIIYFILFNIIELNTS